MKLRGPLLALVLVLGGTGLAGAQAISAGQTVTATDSTSPTEALISALKKSWGQEARGEAVLELVFPPSAEPLRRARALPRLGGVPGLIRRNFTVTAAADTAAGRPAVRYTLTPANPAAARWTVTVDAAWKVPLAYREEMPGGTLARRAELLSVGTGLSRLAQPYKAQTPTQGLRKALLAALPGLKIPAGFEPLSVKVRAGGDAEVVLSDGLNVLALVVSPRTVRSASGVAARRLNNQSVWLVGNLPQDALGSALAGLRRVDAGALATLTGTFPAPAASNQ